MSSMTLCETTSAHAAHGPIHLPTPNLRVGSESPSTVHAEPADRTRRGDAVTLFRAWLRHPLRTAAIAPSSAALARLITRDIAATDRVVELGAGTGVFTRALVARGVLSSRLTVVEANPELADLLHTRFRDAHVVCGDAATDSWQLGERPETDAVISGLPLLSMPVDAVARVLSTAISVLAPRGRFYQFTYGPACTIGPGLMSALHLRASRTGWTPLNLPPASVYQIERKPQ